MGRYGRYDYGRRFGGGMAHGRNPYGSSGPRRPTGYGAPYEDGWDGGWRGARPPEDESRFSGQRYDAWGPAGPSQQFRGRPGPAARWRWNPSQPAGGGDVDHVRVADIMTPNPEAVTPDTSIVEVARRMRDLDVGVMPIVDDEDTFRLQGIVTDRDIAVRAAAEGMDMKKTVAREIMSPAVQTVGENDHVRDVFSVMKRARVRRVPVTDANGRLVGIVAQADLAVNYAGLDLQRETEVEEVIERISEPARPRWGREAPGEPQRSRFSPGRAVAEMEMPDRLRRGWSTLRQRAEHMIGRGYDRGWR